MNITRRMSDSHIYELENIVWDDFSISDDHLVPHPQIQQIEVSTGQTESYKKLKNEAGMTGSSGSHGAEVRPATEKASSSYPKIRSDRVLDDGSWSHNPHASQIYYDLIAKLSSEGTAIASDDFISSNNLYIGDPNPINKSCSLGAAPLSGTDNSYLYNGHANKKTADPLFYEWPEIENFDADQMLRTCDSTFGFGDSVKEDEMCWFSSSTAIDGSNAAKKLQENFNNSPQSNEISFDESSFRQLQELMEQLDLSAKLRIRDSLYRLARSAEQRLGASTVSRIGQAGTEHAGLLDIETDTNPID